MTHPAIDALRADPKLRPIIDRHGELTIQPADDSFERLTVSIINQQLSTASADAIRERVFDQFDITPEGILASDPDDLRDAGLSRQKIEYLQNIAEAYIDRGFGYEYFAEKPDPEVIDELTTIRGIGDWTAKMYLMFCLGREDVFPVEDLGIRKGMHALYHNDLTRSDMYEIADDWRPYRSYAARYIWRSYD